MEALSAFRRRPYECGMQYRDGSRSFTVLTNMLLVKLLEAIWTHLGTQKFELRIPILEHNGNKSLLSRPKLCEAPSRLKERIPFQDSTRRINIKPGTTPSSRIPLLSSPTTIVA